MLSFVDYCGGVRKIDVHHSPLRIDENVAVVSVLNVKDILDDCVRGHRVHAHALRVLEFGD